MMPLMYNSLQNINSSLKNIKKDVKWYQILKNVINSIINITKVTLKNTGWFFLKISKKTNKQTNKTKKPKRNKNRSMNYKFILLCVCGLKRGCHWQHSKYFFHDGATIQILSNLFSKDLQSIAGTVITMHTNWWTSLWTIMLMNIMIKPSKGSTREWG